jgi:hypothetical protein
LARATTVWPVGIGRLRPLRPPADPKHPVRQAKRALADRLEHPIHRRRHQRRRPHIPKRSLRDVIPRPHTESNKGGNGLLARSVAMKLTGHKTEAVYRRYAIVSQADLEEAARRLAAAVAADSTVAPHGSLTVATAAVDDLRRRTEMAAVRVGTRGRPARLSGGRRSAARSANRVSEVTEKMVGRDGIEPPTPGFSVLCSTN